MAGQRKAREADHAFREAIGEVLSCISADGLFAGPAKYESPEHPRTMGFRTARARLTTVYGGTLYLAVEHEYAVAEDDAGEWRPTTRSYIYTVFDADEKRLIGYHFHPAGRGDAPIPFPHLHIYLPQALGDRSLQKLHLPTSRVAIEDIVEFLITGFEVRARRDDWRAVLAKRRQAFVDARRWA